MARMPDPFRTLTGEIRKLREEVRQLRNRSAFDNSGLTAVDPGQLIQSGSITIPDNGLLMVDGGDVVMLDEAPSAQELFRLGAQDFGDRGITIFRNDGTVALVIKDVFDDGVQRLMMYDREGSRIGGDSVLSPAGFDVPHVPMVFIPTDYTSSATAQATASATFVATHEFRGFRQNPALKAQFMVKCSDATTAAEIQVYNVINSVYLGGFAGSPAVHTITVPVATTAWTLFEFSSALVLPGSTSDDLHLQIHARVTAGAGTVSVAPVRTVGSGF